MAVLTMPEESLIMLETIKKIKNLYPDLKFKKADSCYWSPMTKEIYYSKGPDSEIKLWSLLHEVGHALCNHTSYDADFTLLRLEVEAWERANKLAERLNITISKSHIEDCLDTYRDWLYKRSICPTCSSKCFQQSDFKHYQCFNCHTVWKVSPSRFCRSYRTKETTTQLQNVFI